MSRLAALETQVYAFLQKAGLEHYIVDVVSEGHYGAPDGVYVEPVTDNEPFTGTFCGQWVLYVGRGVTKEDVPYWAIRAFADIIFYGLRMDHVSTANSSGAVEMEWEEALDRLAHALMPEQASSD